ncbi:MAG: EamA family transporter [Chloroflexi bacterium]|nr:EamA family transporter [Chloroflexota bacterium]
MSRHKARLLFALTALLWSSSGLLIKIVNWQPLSIFGARSLIASFVFMIYLRQFSFRWTRFQIAGAIGYAVAQLTFITATKLTTAANVIFLQYTAPIYIVLFGYWLLRERPQRSDWIAMPVIFAGLLLFFGDELSFDGVCGNVLAIISGMAVATMMLCMRAQKDGVPAQTMLLGSILSTIIGLPFTLQETWTPLDVSIILYLGIFQIGLASLLYSTAIKYVPALESILILTLEPIFNPLWVFLVLGETPGPLALVGGVLVLGAITARAISGTQKQMEPSEQT